MNAATKHAPTPWSLVRSPPVPLLARPELPRALVDADGARVVLACVTITGHDDPRAIANTALVAHRVAVHDQLVAAVKMAQAEALTIGPRLSGQYARNQRTIADTCAAAIAAAEGKA